MVVACAGSFGGFDWHLGRVVNARQQSQRSARRAPRRTTGHAWHLSLDSSPDV